MAGTAMETPGHLGLHPPVVNLDGGSDEAHFGFSVPVVFGPDSGNNEVQVDDHETKDITTEHSRSSSAITEQVTFESPPREESDETESLPSTGSGDSTLSELRACLVAAQRRHDLLTEKLKEVCVQSTPPIEPAELERLNSDVGRELERAGEILAHKGPHVEDEETVKNAKHEAVKQAAKDAVAQARRVHEFMARTSMKQHALARHVGCSQGTLSSWLKCKYNGDVIRITNRVKAALDDLEAKPIEELRAQGEIDDSPPVPVVRRKNFTREQVDVLEQIAHSTPNPPPQVVERLSVAFAREPRHIVKWFSNWRSRKLPKQAPARAAAADRSPLMSGAPSPPFMSSEPSTGYHRMQPMPSQVMPPPQMHPATAHTMMFHQHPHHAPAAPATPQEIPLADLQTVTCAQPLVVPLPCISHAQVACEGV